MPSTPILGITQVSTSQAGKETTINDAIIALESAGNAKLDVNLAAGNVTLSASQATRNYIFKATGATEARELRFPIAVNSNPFNRLFAVRNESGYGLTVKFASGAGSTVVIPNNQARLISAADGLNMTVAAEPATVVSFTSLTDVPGSYTGDAGKVLAVNLAENALEFIDIVSYPDFTGNAGKYLVVNGTADGVEWADASTVTGFTDLTDTPANYTGQGGKIVAVKAAEDGVEFIEAPEAEAVEFIAAARWRIFVVDAGLEDQTGFNEVEFLNADGIDLTGTGTASASNEALGFEAEFAFDNVLTAGTGWLTEDTYTGDVWIEYEFTGPVTPRRVRLTPVGGFATSAPMRFLIQYYNGATWVDLGDRTAVTWADATPQTFKVNGVPLTSVADAPSDGVLYGRRNAAWEEVVAEVEEAPIDGTAYNRKDGDWEAVGASLPPGGDAGQVLTKNSPTDGDADWTDPSGGLAEVITEAGTSANLLPANAGKYQRWSNTAAKTLTIQTEATTAQPANGEWNIRNTGASNLTIVASGGVTINAPAGGSLVVPTGGVVTLKRSAADVFDLIGATVSSGGGDALPALTGNANRFLSVNLAEDDVEWSDIGPALPTGGVEGQVLTKQSATDGDATWENPTGGSDGSGSTAFAGARVGMSATTNHAVTSSFAAFSWAVEQRDTHSFWTAGAPTRFTIPAGVTKIRLWTSFQVDSADVPANHLFNFRKNGTVSFAGNATWNFGGGGYSNPGCAAVSDVLDVVPGDYFEVVYFSSASFSITSSASFSIEVVEGSVLAGGVGKAFSGALVKKSADQAITIDTFTPLTFNTETYDTEGWHDNVTNNTRLTVPTGVTKVRVAGRVTRDSQAGQLFAEIYKNGAIGIGLPAMDTDTGGTDHISLSSAVIDVVPGDYFELVAFVNSASSVTNDSWFSIEKVEGTYVANDLVVPTATLLDQVVGTGFSENFGTKSLLLSNVTIQPSGIIGRGKNISGSTTLTVKLKGYHGENFNSVGIYATDGTKYVNMIKLSNNGVQLGLENWSNRTTFSANAGNRYMAANLPDWFRMIYNAGTGILATQISMDGEQWVQFAPDNTYLGAGVVQMGVSMARVNATVGPASWIEHCVFT